MADHRPDGWRTRLFLSLVALLLLGGLSYLGVTLFQGLAAPTPVPTPLPH